MKTCSKCNRELSEDRFVKSGRYKDGLYPSCKDCRNKVLNAYLDANQMCCMCKTEPHMKGNAYCRTCLRIVNGLPIERERPNVDRNNKTMCCGCKIRPRAKGGHYCVECKSKMHAEWRNGNGADYIDRGNNRMKAYARRFVHWKVKSGKLKKEPCEVCGNLEAEAHHYKGYERENWLTVKWLCLTHHREAHKLQVDS